MKISRRKFLGASASAVIVAGMMTKGKVFGANERIRMCCIGINGQGGSHIKALTDKFKDDADVVALCDVDQTVLDKRAAEVKAATGKEPKKYRDMREAFADPDIDAVTIATPNHWHALATIWACQAGKDVYVEKPMAHSFWEGKQVIAAAKKFNRIVQHGTQQRSSERMMRDMKLIHEGFIGDVVHSRGYVYKNGGRHDIGKGKAGDPPEFLDYDLWQGPAQERPWMWREGGDAKNQPGGLWVHYNWHWFWDYGNGESGNQGVHEMDVAVWGMNKGLPTRVYSTGGRYAWADDGETPNTQVIDFTYPDGTILTFEVRNLGSFPEGGKEPCSNSVFGTKGYWVRGEGFYDYKHKSIEVTAEPPKSRGPFGNFADAIRSRKWEDIHGNPEEAFDGCAHIHIGNIAYRLQRALTFDPATSTFPGDEEATKMLKREYRDPFTVPEIA
ncbi:MAG: Gfo/Idh/MocA family oxidoreductase [FCB group bacterium]|jgi:predicted dehydrogenase|nr:Gfo/Idh/MocA family oxidoreductase [FCB group bacterium]